MGQACAIERPASFLSQPHAILVGARHVCRGTFSCGLMWFNYDP